MNIDKKSDQNPEPSTGKTELNDHDLDMVTGGSIDTHLKIDGIKGESTDTTHKDTIRIESF